MKLSAILQIITDHPLTRSAWLHFRRERDLLPGGHGLAQGRRGGEVGGERGAPRSDVQAQYTLNSQIGNVSEKQ